MGLRTLSALSGKAGKIRKRRLRRERPAAGLGAFSRHFFMLKRSPIRVDYLTGADRWARLTDGFTQIPKLTHSLMGIWRRLSVRRFAGYIRTMRAGLEQKNFLAVGTFLVQHRAVLIEPLPLSSGMFSNAVCDLEVLYRPAWIASSASVRVPFGARGCCIAGQTSRSPKAALLATALRLIRSNFNVPIPADPTQVCPYGLREQCQLLLSRSHELALIAGQHVH
jgi:hypothetical protein